MKTQNDLAKEAVALLEQAKALIALLAENSQTMPTQNRFLPPQRSIQSRPVKSDEWCPCGNKKVLSRHGSLYCHPCYIYQKENGGR